MTRRPLILLVFVAPSAWSAPRARTPAEATAFIRVVGELRAEVKDVWEKSIEKEEVEIGTGSGFVISPYGHVLTNYHVIAGQQTTRNVNGVDVDIRLEVDRIEVVFPSPGPAADGSSPDRRFVASVSAVDPELDLAVLSISGTDIPYLALGDSEAASVGQPVRVLGFPFGRRVEVGKASLPDIVPRVSTSNGSLSARRAGEGGLTRYLQTSATINPGNSGGPMLDRDGFVLGVVRMKLAKGEGIGFAIPINLVKDFLETHGLDALLPVTRMRLGPAQTLEGKGLRLRLPEGLEDLSPNRLRIDTGRGPDAALPLRVDRVASPWSLTELEGALVSGGVFEAFVAEAPPQEILHGRDGRSLIGRAKGKIPSDPATLFMEFALVDLGREKLVARFVGADEQVAFNASVLRGALRSMEVEPLLKAEVARALRVGWMKAPLPAPRAPRVVVAEGWVREEASPFPCRGLPPPDSALRTSPEGDFTVSFLVGWWASGPEPSDAAAACSPSRGSMGGASYSAMRDYVGTSYRVEGVFLDRPDGLLQLELVTPVDKHEFVIDAFRNWVAQNRE